MTLKQSLFIIFFPSLFLVSIFFLWSQFFLLEKHEEVFVNDFESCITFGNLVLESYPRQCRTPEGEIFIEDIGNELQKTDLLRISSPRPNDSIRSPLSISGEARGHWFFEASFPAVLLGENGEILGSAIVEAKEDWMTEEFVPFEATLSFTPEGRKGVLYLKKENPSGLLENDDAVFFPVYFEQ